MLTDQQGRDQESGEDEKDIDAEPARGQEPLSGVEGNDREDGESSEAVEGGAVAESFHPPPCYRSTGAERATATDPSPLYCPPVAH